jgi:hypothetical protein
MFRISHLLAEDEDPRNLTRFAESHVFARSITEDDRNQRRDEFELRIRDAIRTIQKDPASSWAEKPLDNFKWLYRQADRMQNEVYKNDALNRLMQCVPGEMFYEFVKYDVTLRRASAGVQGTGNDTAERDVENDFYIMVKSVAQKAGFDTRNPFWRRDFFDIGGLVPYPVANTILEEMRQRMEACKKTIAESQRQSLAARRVASLRQDSPIEAGPSNSQRAARSRAGV